MGDDPEGISRFGTMLDALDEMLDEARAGDDLDRINDLEAMRAQVWRQRRALDAAD